MDLEGAEAMAIEGAGEALARTRAVIFEQLGDDAVAGRLLAGGGALRCGCLIYQT